MFVNGTLATLVVEKDTIAVGILHQTTTYAHRSDIFGFELVQRHLEMLRECFNLCLVYPHIPGRTGATIAAAGTLES